MERILSVSHRFLSLTVERDFAWFCRLVLSDLAGPKVYICLETKRAISLECFSALLVGCEYLTTYKDVEGRIKN